MNSLTPWVHYAHLAFLDGQYPFPVLSPRRETGYLHGVGGHLVVEIMTKSPHLDNLIERRAEVIQCVGSDGRDTRGQLPKYAAALRPSDGVAHAARRQARAQGSCAC